MTSEEIEEYIKQAELEGYLDPNCSFCQKHYYPEVRKGKKTWDIFAPSHKPSSRCESGKRPHCTCDVCF